MDRRGAELVNGLILLIQPEQARVQGRVAWAASGLLLLVTRPGPRPQAPPQPAPQSRAPSPAAAAASVPASPSPESRSVRLAAPRACVAGWRLRLVEPALWHIAPAVDAGPTESPATVLGGHRGAPRPADGRVRERSAQWTAGAAGALAPPRPLEPPPGGLELGPAFSSARAGPACES